MNKDTLIKTYQEEYPNATDLILWFVFGSKDDDNYLYKTYNKTHGYELSNLALDYEYNWEYSMVEIENDVLNTVGINDY